MLLYWGTVEPSGQSKNVAAIRFASQVRIRSIRLFATGSKPFAQQPDIIANTQPYAFYLDVYFNAQPLKHPDAQQKPKASNALVSASLAYPGGDVEYSLDSGSEFSTRLMIIFGEFKCLSISIYGDLVSEMPSPTIEYDASSLPHVEVTTLPRLLDVSTSWDPKTLAESLLALIPDAPPLPLLCRLMFCLKPSNEDWDNPEFPYIYANLEGDSADFDLQQAIDIISRPIPDDANHENLQNFADKVVNGMGPTDEDQAYLLGKLLALSATQHPVLVRVLLDRLQLERIFTLGNLETSTLALLVDAAANADVAKQLNSDEFLQVLAIIQSEYDQEDGRRNQLAKQLVQRIVGWEILEDALSNTQADFGKAALTIKQLGSDENALGIFLTSMITNASLVDRLSENRVPPQPSTSLPPLWSGATSVSHDDFIAFYRAFVGVAATIAVYAWSDSVPVETCRERTLAILRFWQNVDGYRDIVDHLLLLRQMTFRLECMLPLDDDLPSQAGIDAEHILKNLAWQPESMLHSGFVEVMQAIRSPLTFITEEDVSTFQDVANRANDGLPSAVQVITAPPAETITRKSTLQFRVALAIFSRAHCGDQEAYRQDMIWEDGYYDLPAYLVDHLVRLSEDVHSQFTYTIPSHTPQELTAEIFFACEELSRLIRSLSLTHPLPSRLLFSITRAVANLFVCTDSADLAFTPGCGAWTAASRVRQACVDMVVTLVTPMDGDLRGESLVTVLRTLLRHAHTPGDHDVVHHVTQMVWLIDHVLTSAPSDTTFLMSLATDLRSFLWVLDTDNRVHILRRLVNLDNGITGVGEWLVLDILHRIQLVMQVLSGSHRDLDQEAFRHWQVASVLHFISDILQSSSSLSSWSISTFSGVNDCSCTLHLCLDALLDQGILYPDMIDIAFNLQPHVSALSTDLSSSIFRVLIRATAVASFRAFEAASAMLEHIPLPSAESGQAFREICEALQAVAGGLEKEQTRQKDVAESIFRFMKSITGANPEHDEITLSIKRASLEDLCQYVREHLPEANEELDSIRASLDTVNFGMPTAVLATAPKGVEMPLGRWEEILSRQIPTPKTPPQHGSSQSADMLGLVTVSPPNALIRSPEVKGLTKTYAANDFRQLRQTSSVRQNTSRLPSMHVDDFELGGALQTGTLPVAPLPAAGLTTVIPESAGLPPNPMLVDMTQVMPPFVRPP